MIAFFDMPEGQVYLFDKKTGGLVDKVPFGTGEGFNFSGLQLPEGIEESCVSLPLRLLNFRVLELELADIEKIREVLPFELEGLILDEPESVVIDARIIEDLNNRRKVLAVYLKKSALKELLDALGALDMDPRVVTSLDLGHALDTYTSVEEMSRRLLLDRLVEGDERVQRALREIIKGPVVNLRRGELSYTRDTERTKRTLKFTAAAALLLMLFFSADMALRTAGTKKQTAVIERGILKAYSDIFPGEKPQGTQGLTYRMKAHLKDMKDRAAFSSGLSPLELLLGLQGLGLPGLTDITLDKDFIVLKGEASSLSEVQDAKGRLEGLLLDVNISETGQSVRDKIAFTITARGGR